MVEARQNHTTEEILQRNGKIFREKILSSLEEMLAVSRYSRDDTLSELGLGTEVFVTIVLALANKDLFLCVSLLKLAETISPLLTANRYIAHQMLELFQMSPRVIQEALQYLDKLEKYRLFNIPDSIGAILRHTSDIMPAVQSASNVPTNEMSAVLEIPEEQEEYSRTEPSEAVEVSSEREEAVNDIEATRDLPNQHEILETINMIVQDSAEEGDTPLHICVRNNSEAGVKVLLDLGYEVNVTNNNNKTSLLLAVEMGNREIVDLLLQNGADTNISDNNGNTPLFATAITGYLEIIRKLVEKGADIDHKSSEGFTVLYRAVKESKRESAILLKELGASLCPDDIINAAKCYDVQVTELLKELGADINVRDSYGQTPLLWAVYNNNELLVRYLVESGADPKASTSDGWTPLHLAVCNNYEPLVRYLVEAGADPMAKTSDGQTPLHRAVSNNNENLVKYLVEAGADPKVKTSQGVTPLHWAVERNNEPLVRYLVEAGADPKARISDGQTPLHRAVSNNNETLVRYLVEAGADPKASTSKGVTPLSLSRDPKISAYLRSKGAPK